MRPIKGFIYCIFVMACQNSVEDCWPYGRDPSTFFREDKDGDGFDGLYSVASPTGTVPGPLPGTVPDTEWYDCNDVDPAVYPGAPEAECSGSDDNCDGYYEDAICIPQSRFDETQAARDANCNGIAD